MRRKIPSFLLAVVGLGLLGFAQRSIAQTDLAERKEKTGVTIVTLGTGGGPTPKKERSQPANLLVVNGTLYLVDAGEGATTRIVQSGYDFKRIGKIFITHLHSDHTNGLASLLAAEWDASRQDPIDIYGSRVETLVKGAIAYLTPNADIRWTEGTRTPMTDVFHGHNVEPGLIYQDENVKLIAVENTHYHFAAGSPPYGRDKSYSYRFEAPGRVVVFTGDTGPSAPPHANPPNALTAPRGSRRGAISASQTNRAHLMAAVAPPPPKQDKDTAKHPSELVPRPAPALRRPHVRIRV